MIICDELYNQKIEIEDYALSHLDVRELNKSISEEFVNDILFNLLKDLNCTRVFPCGRPMMTTYPMYRRNIFAYLYVVDTIYNNLVKKNEDTSIANNFKSDAIHNLVVKHINNVKFEKENPYVEPTTNKTKKKTPKVRKYKTKDLFTGEDVYLLENNKKHIVSKNPDRLNNSKVQQIPLSCMKFKFK